MTIGVVGKETIERMRSKWNALTQEEKRALTNLIIICNPDYVKSKLKEVIDNDRYKSDKPIFEQGD